MRFKFGSGVDKKSRPKVVIDVPGHCLGGCMNSFGNLHRCALSAALGATSLEVVEDPNPAQPMIDCIEKRIKRKLSPSDASVTPVKVTLADVHKVERYASYSNLEAKLANEAKPANEAKSADKA